MTDDWFNEYMFRLVVETKYASKKALEVLKQKPIRLPAWDPMFAEQFFFFRLDTKEKEPKRKNQGCVFPATPVLPPAKGQKLATLKQSALFNAGETTCA